MNNIGFNHQKEVEDTDGSEHILGGSGPEYKGLSDLVAGIVGAVHAWSKPINGIYPRTTRAFNHAIDIIKELAIKYLPDGTIQRGKEDWMNCASNAPNNEEEKQHNFAIENKLFSFELIQWFKDVGFINPKNGKFESSDAWVSIGSETTRNGNSLKAPIQFIYNKGIIPRSMLPDDPQMTWAEYHNPNRITQVMRDVAKEYCKRMKMNYERVYRADFPTIIDKPRWDIFDSYRDKVDDDFIKRLAPDYEFMPYGYRIYLNEEASDELEQKVNIMQQLLCLIKKKVLDILKITETMPKPVLEPPKYLWNTKAESRHSCRVIMDEHKLKWSEKDLLCAVIEAESNFNINATNKNKGSTDWGICQINDYFWIGEGKHFVSVEEVLNCPDKSVRFMIGKFLVGRLNLWCAYTNGSYRRFL